MSEERGYKKTLRDIYNDGIKIRDDQDRIGLISTFGEGIVGQRISDVLELFQYNINTETLTSTVANGGTVTQADSMAILTSSTATNGAAQLQSKHVVRYRAGHEVYSIFTSLWANGGVAGATQYIGLFNGTDGFFLGYNGTDFVVGRRKDSVDTTVSTFNGSAEFTNRFDPTKLNIFSITFGWLGTAPVNFYWMNPEGKLVLIHQMQLPNTLTGPTVTNPVLPVCMDITKTSGATSIVMKSGSWHGGVIHNGIDKVSDRFFSKIISATTVSTEAVLINFQNVSTFQSKTNLIDVEGALLEAASDGTKIGLVKIYRNLAITSPSWTNVNATNSVIQTDVAGTVTPSDNNLLLALTLGRTDSKLINLKDLDFVLHPGETLTVTAQSTANMDFSFFLRWAEHF
jgi:hypothetical protein